MKLHKNLLVITLILTLFGFFACAGHQKIKFNEAFLRIKPAAPLPEAIAKKQPVNLYVQIENVADMRTSYKNHLDLYVNNFLIIPEQEITNITSDYIYRLSLQPGIYKVKALYYASTGWEEKSFKILSRDEQVMVFPDKKAVLKVTLRKDSWGAPVDKVTHFDVSYEPIEKSGN
ncbi:MAG: hypothetical protein JSW07_00380 [bacterium]|nr:MAG: hypothetical protein JSW07_00380 [bacterium]